MEERERDINEHGDRQRTLRKEICLEKERGKRYEYGERERKEMSMEIETENIQIWIKRERTRIWRTIEK